MIVLLREPLCSYTGLAVRSDCVVVVVYLTYVCS